MSEGDNCHLEHVCDFQDCLITIFNVMDHDKGTFYQLFPYL